MDVMTLRWRAWGPAVLVALALPGTGACQPGVECTLIGCEDGVTAQIGADVLAGAEGRVTVQTCVDRTCQEDRFEPDMARHGLMTFVEAPGLRAGDDLTVAVTVTDEGRGVLAETSEQVTLHRSQPNGPRCPPVCVGGGVMVDGEPGAPVP